MKKNLLVTAAMLFTTIALALPGIMNIGLTPNAFSFSNKSQCNFWYDEGINTLVLMYQSDSTYSGNHSGCLRYVSSMNGGTGWSFSVGRIVSIDSGSFAAKPPLCGIYNPISNTNPLNAYVAYSAPSLSSNGMTGRADGVEKLDSSGSVRHLDSLSQSSFTSNMFVVKNTRDAWTIGSMRSNTIASNYLDTIIVAHGVWNNGTNDYNFTYSFLPAPASALSPDVIDMDIAFDDAGTKGYIALIINNDPFNIALDSLTYYIDVYTTNDGGLFWSSPVHLDIQTIADSLLAQDTTVRYGATNDLDVVVDANSKLHILTGISVTAGFTIHTDAGNMGLFDINNVNGYWKADLLDKPHTYLGIFGDGSSDNPRIDVGHRPFASRSWDGTKLFFNWFDTDTVTFGSADGNKFPDLHSIGYNVTNGLWTNAMNQTAGTPVGASCTFGNGSYYVINQGSNVFSVPVAIQIMSDFIATGSPCVLYYINRASVDMNTATIAHTVGTNQTHPIDTLNFINTVGINQLDANVDEVSIYPNPAPNRLNIHSAKEKINRIEIVDVNGRRIYSRQINAVDVEIPVAEFSTGIYVVVVITNQNVFHKKVHVVK